MEPKAQDAEGAAKERGQTRRARPRHEDALVLASAFSLRSGRYIERFSVKYSDCEVFAQMPYQIVTVYSIKHCTRVPSSASQISSDLWPCLSPRLWHSLGLALAAGARRDGVKGVHPG